MLSVPNQFSPEYHPVWFGSVDTTRCRSRSTDVVLPCQSLLCCDPDAVSRCITEVNLEKLSLLSASFGQSAFSAEYDPWIHTDSFGRSKIYKGLHASYKAVVTVPSTPSVRLEKEGASSTPDESAVRAPNSVTEEKIGQYQFKGFIVHQEACSGLF